MQGPLPPASSKAHLAPPHNLDHRQKVLGQRRELLWEGWVLSEEMGGGGFQTPLQGNLTKRDHG